MQRSTHKLGKKPRNRLSRERPTRQAYDRVLIVSEGQKTEPTYFSELINHYRLGNANIEVVGEGADPSAVVQRALRLKRREKRRGDGYDRVYCVFDRNGHANFNAASSKAQLYSDNQDEKAEVARLGKEGVARSSKACGSRVLGRVLSIGCCYILVMSASHM